ncbi:YMGG-like glycine zipper-containing protein [Hymenobacter radiodurans]|uniref:YMGG-like glycine zipper-containing protein n=1 Tax=Hymenobacter radiodurans TaxID=2496028 RepID=UPI0021D34BBF|nr:YMGG-like glycine zipper-containing protein [Hymenobacter radiodurans]
MKTFRVYFAVAAAMLFLGSNAALAQSDTQPIKKGWSRKGKGAAIGAGTGAAAGAIIAGKGDRGKGAVIGAGAGAVSGALIGKRRDKKKDPVRHREYTKKD